MSNEAITWAFKQKLPTTDKFVLLSLADYADENLSCYPSHKKTADRVGASPATVKRAIGRLEDAGYITIARRHRNDGSFTSNRYRVNIDREDPIAHSEPRGHCEPTPAHSSAPTPGHGYDPTSVHSYDLTDPSLNHQATINEPGTAGAGSEVALDAPDAKPWKDIAQRAYDSTGGALNYMGMYKIAEWAIDKRGSTPADTEAAIASLWRAGRAVTKQTVGQYLDGIITPNNKPAPAERMSDTAAMGAKLMAMQKELL